MDIDNRWWTDKHKAFNGFFLLKVNVIDFTNNVYLQAFEGNGI